MRNLLGLLPSGDGRRIHSRGWFPGRSRGAALSSHGWVELPRRGFSCCSPWFPMLEPNRWRQHTRGETLAVQQPDGDVPTLAAHSGIRSRSALGGTACGPAQLA